MNAPALTHWVSALLSAKSRICVPCVLLRLPIAVSRINAVRGDTLNPPLLGMTRAVSEDVVRRAMKRIDERSGLAWLAAELRDCIAPVLSQSWILDIDCTVKPLYGHQQGAQIGYNPHKPGRPSHCYHSYFMANTRICLGVEVCGGKDHAAQHGLPGLWELLDALPRTHWPAFLRGDCAYGNEALLCAAEIRRSYLRHRLSIHVFRFIGSGSEHGGLACAVRAGCLRRNRLIFGPVIGAPKVRKTAEGFRKLRMAFAFVRRSAGLEESGFELSDAVALAHQFAHVVLAFARELFTILFEHADELVFDPVGDFQVTDFEAQHFAVEGVVPRDPAGQREETAQPALALAGQVLHVVKAFAAHQHPAHGDHEHFVQEVITFESHVRHTQRKRRRKLCRRSDGDVDLRTEWRCC